ncbi:MAG: hypothetical protein ACFCUV_23965 [Rivularia sp. (in: cyanobacteria)]
MPAIREAFKHGADIVEFDIDFTTDCYAQTSRLIPALLEKNNKQKM